MEHFTVNWIAILAIGVLPAAIVGWLVRQYYKHIIEDHRLDTHIELEALRNRMNVQMEIMRDRLADENKAHLRTISMLTRSQEHQSDETHLHVLEESIRLQELEYEYKTL